MDVPFWYTQRSLYRVAHFRIILPIYVVWKYIYIGVCHPRKLHIYYDLSIYLSIYISIYLYIHPSSQMTRIKTETPRNQMFSKLLVFDWSRILLWWDTSCFVCYQKDSLYWHSHAYLNMKYNVLFVSRTCHPKSWAIKLRHLPKISYSEKSIDLSLEHNKSSWVLFSSL